MLLRPKAIVSLSLVALLVACSGVRTADSLIPSATAGSTSAAPPGAAPPGAAGREDAVVAEAVSLASAGVRDRGSAAPNAELHVALTLRYRNQGDLDNLIARQQERSQTTPWLTDGEFNRLFAPSESTYRRVIGSLKRAGLLVGDTFADRTVVDASGTVAHFERYFGTRIHAVAQKGLGTRYANVVPAHAPAGMADSLLAVDGLSTIVSVAPFHQLVPKTARFSLRPALQSSPLFGPPSTATGLQGYGPLAFSAGYDLPIMHAGGANGHYDGAGRTAAIVIDSDFETSDVTSFLKYFKIVQKGAIKRVLVDKGPPPGDESLDAVEATLDTETIASNAPGATLYVYEIPSLEDADITDAYAKAVSDNRADAVNSSFGGCEVLLGKTIKAWSAIAEQGLAKGMTFSASTGDGGGQLCPNSPASSPYFAAVGGTALEIGASGAWTSEAGWPGSGGGVSVTFGLPAWQSAVAGINGRGRNLPDVAFDADPVSGAAIYFGGSWNTLNNPIGGTSLASPIYVSAVTEMDQVKGARLGLASGALFARFANGGYGTTTTYYHDITLGNSGIYYAVPGYDLVTGIGSMDAWNTVESM